MCGRGAIGADAVTRFGIPIVGTDVTKVHLMDTKKIQFITSQEKDTAVLFVEAMAFSLSVRHARNCRKKFTKQD
jgi:hypothetical protein